MLHRGEEEQQQDSRIGRVLEVNGFETSPLPLPRTMELRGSTSTFALVFSQIQVSKLELPRPRSSVFVRILN
jgi:hypothetical protein